jgi:hypothetical protein
MTNWAVPRDQNMHQSWSGRGPLNLRTLCRDQSRDGKSVVREEEEMKLSTMSCLSVVALAAFASGTNGALAEPPDPCRTGCMASRGHVTNYLNPQPLPPGIYGPGHGGSSSGFVTPGAKYFAGGAGAGKIR